MGLFLLGQMKLVLILPGVVPALLYGATAGVFSNATGGRRLRGDDRRICQRYHCRCQCTVLPVLGAIGFANTTFSDADFGVIGDTAGSGVICRRWLSRGWWVALFTRYWWRTTCW